MFRRSVLPIFGYILIFVTGLELVVAQSSVDDLMGEIFNFLDKNDDGLLSSQEFETLIQIILNGAKETELKQRFTAADKDGDRKINQADFQAIITSTAKEIIETVDSNKDQIISHEEYSTYYNTTDDETDDEMEEVDEDGDGKATYDELLLYGLENIFDQLEVPSDRGIKFGLANVISELEEPSVRGRMDVSN